MYLSLMVSELKPNLLLLFSFIFWGLTAQEVPKVINFTKNDYRAHNQNWQITQSPDNEMFFGNGEGLMSFDASFWRMFHLPNNQVVRSVTADSTGRIFVGGFAEFGFWERNYTGNYQYHSLSSTIEFDKTRKEEIWHIIVKGKKVFFQSFSTIYCYDYQSVKIITPPGSIMFLHNIHDKLLLHVIDKGLFELADDANFHLIEKSEFLIRKDVSTILPLENGFLVGTTKDGIFKYQNGQFELWSNETQAISKEFQLNKGVKLANGNFALGTILNGIFIVQPDGKNIYHISKENGLQNNTVLSLFEDHAQNLWAGLDKGIDLLDLNTPLTFLQDKSGKIGAVYTATFFNNRLYVGTNQGVFYKNTDGKYQLLRGLQGQAWDLKIIDNQLFCGHNSGTFIIKSDNSISKIAETTGGWNLIRHPLMPNILVQGTYTGVILFKKNPNGNWAFWKKVGDFSEPIKKIEFDEYGNLWALNAYNKIYKIRFTINPDLTLNTEGVIPTQLPSGTNFYFSKIDNQLIFNTENIFYTFDGNTFIRINELASIGILNEKCKIFKNNTNNDVLKIYPDFIEYSNAQSNKKTRFRVKLITDYESVIPLDSSRYLFGLDDGYAIFDKTVQIQNAHYSPKPIIRLFTKDGQIFHFYPSDKNNLVELPPQYRSIRFDFSLPFYTNIPHFQYATNQEWSQWEETTSREFSNLSAGKQYFKLKNNITDEISSIEFKVKPYWYETNWAKIVYFLLFLGAIYLLRKYHDFQLEKQRLDLENEKLKELEKQRIKSDNEKLHFEIINKSKELANSTMNIIQKNEILIEIKEELDEMKKELGSKFSEKHYSRLLHKIDSNMSSEENWRVFEDNFNEVHEDFLKRLKLQYPDLSPGDLKLAAYLRLNLSSKEISPLLFISVRSVENKRYRLRKKLNLSEDDNLTEFIISF